MIHYGKIMYQEQIEIFLVLKLSFQANCMSHEITVQENRLSHFLEFSNAFKAENTMVEKLVLLSTQRTATFYLSKGILIWMYMYECILQVDLQTKCQEKYGCDTIGTFLHTFSIILLGYIHLKKSHFFLRKF